MTIMGVLVSVFGVLFFIVLVWAAIAQTQENRLRHELEKWKADCARERHDAGEARTRLTEYRRCVMKMFEQMPDAYLLDLDMAIKSVLASRHAPRFGIDGGGGGGTT